MISKWTVYLRAGLLSTALCFTGGCGVELAMIGAAASAASSGSAVFKRGKLNASWMGPFDHVVAAAEIAGSELGLTLRSTNGNPDKGTWKTVMATDDGDKVTVKTYRKTDQLTEFVIDVGISGSESTARLLLKRMAVAINLDARQDGSGEVVPLMSLPTQEILPPPDPSEINSDDPTVSPTAPLPGDQL